MLLAVRGPFAAIVVLRLGGEDLDRRVAVRDGRALGVPPLFWIGQQLRSAQMLQLRIDAGDLVRMTFGGIYPGRVLGRQPVVVTERGKSPIEAGGEVFLVAHLAWPACRRFHRHTLSGDQCRRCCRRRCRDVRSSPRLCTLCRELAEQLVDLLPIANRCRGCGRRRAGTNPRRLARDRTYRYRAVGGRRRLSTGREEHQPRDGQTARHLSRPLTRPDVGHSRRRTAVRPVILQGLDATSWPRRAP